MMQVLAQDSDIAIWWASRLEALSALVRLKREATLSEKQFSLARESLDERISECFIVDPSPPVLLRAERLLLAHRLRAADALQLAAALALFKERTAGNSFVCADAQLRVAAENEGFLVIP